MTTNTIDRELEVQMKEDFNRFLDILAHYKPDIKQTLESDFQEALKRDEVYADENENAIHSYVFSQLSRSITNHYVGQYADNSQAVFGLSKDELDEHFSESISWYLDGLTIDFYINSERIFTLNDIQKTMAALIQEWRIDTK
ncbi:hypothetical protein [uncultured Psychrobacter sp.]|uniref:hypothetical protein n=1 Tax=uncultured Psychrobacter sp. TaxID=259303 RepID=UPI0030DD20ED